MNYLLIYAHPNPESFTNAVFQTIKNALSSKEVEVKVIDLYKENFNPLLRVDNNFKRRDLFKDPETKKYRDMIEWADHIIFIYPIWWSGFPAILKGFFERVFVSEFVYSFKNKKPGVKFPEGLMSEKKISCFYTLDTSSFIAKIDPGWLSVRIGIFKFCGFRNVKRYYLPRLKHLNDEARKNWLLKCKKIVANF